MVKVVTLAVEWKSSWENLCTGVSVVSMVQEGGVEDHNGGEVNKFDSAQRRCVSHAVSCVVQDVTFSRVKQRRFLLHSARHYSFNYIEWHFTDPVEVPSHRWLTITYPYFLLN